MKFHKILGIGALMLSFAAGSAFAATKAEKQAEVVKATSTSLEKFYKFKPELKAAVAKAPGYAIFTTYGVSFIFGGSGGTGSCGSWHLMQALSGLWVVGSICGNPVGRDGS